MNIMIMLFLFLSLFASQLLLVTPCVIEKEQVENREEPPSLEVNKTTSESPDPKTPEALWTEVYFPLVEDEHDVKTCRKVGMYVSFAEIGLLIGSSHLTASMLSNAKVNVPPQSRKSS